MASMCGFDLATAIQEALTGTSAALPGSRYLAHGIMKYVKTSCSRYLPAGIMDKAAAVNARLNPIVSAVLS